MTGILESVATNSAQRLVDKAIKEFQYFRHFEDHIQDFVRENNSLDAKRDKVKCDVEDAQRNDNQIGDEVKNWIEVAYNVIRENKRIKQTWSYGWCPYWKYRQGKRLAKRTLLIKDHIQKYNFDKVARPAELPGIRYHASSKDFIDFESRKKKYMELVEALKDGNHYMIGLQGMGGTGKTTVAIQVGKKLEESKSFEKVIFVVVSNPPDVNKIRGDIAGQLGLKLEERVEADHSKLLWSRISNNEKKLLIILDDVWEELNLTKIGIPSGLEHKNCYVLITTRHSKVCQDMGCQQIVRLDTLDDDDALHLFLFHATSDDDDSSRNELEGLARDFLKECGGLPVAIVALGSTLRNWHIGELKAALAGLQNSNPFVDVDEDLVKVYNCLRLSYDNLHCEKAQKLFLLCSIFPKDYEFPINLISRLGIGSGIFEEADNYCAARSQTLAVKNKLIDSSLLQKVGEKECVKMHDFIREVAQWIAKEDIQVIKDSRTTLKTNKRFVFWSSDDFPNQLDDTNLEILLLWISGNKLVKDPNAFFIRMSRLKILFLLGEYDRKVPSPSLPKSLLSLKSIQTLILHGWELGDISILKNIQSLVTLEFKNCLIIELPKNIMELKKLRWLGLRKCEIQRKNPFEVIKRCSQLKELYFVANYIVKDWNTEDDKEIDDEIAQDISPAELQIFSIAYDVFLRFAGDDNSLLRCFKLEHIKDLIPDAIFKYLVRSAEVLELGKIGETSWKNLAPDIIPLENGGMDNLIKLYLYEWDDIECLIDNSKYLYSNTTFFSKLVELYLYGVDVKKLYWGAMPSRFLWQLQILELKECMKLQNIFFDENIKLPHLKVLRLIRCPMFQPSIFQPSVARSLERLEELVIESCHELKSLIAYESLKQEMIVVGSQKNYGLLFPALESLRIRRCGKLEMVFSLLLPGDLPKLKDLYIWRCEELKYIFGEYRVMGQVLQQEIILPLLTEVVLDALPSFISIFQNCEKFVLRPPQVFKEDSKEKHENSKTSAFSWAYGCCFPKDINIGVPNATMKQHTMSQGSCGSSKRMETIHTTECLMRHLLSLQNIREMTLRGCSTLESLFSVSIATNMIMLEKLYIEECEELKDIIIKEAEDDYHLNCTSIFPKLQSLLVWHCNKLEFIFPSSLSRGLQKLKSIHITEAHKLKYVFGKYNDEESVSNENENDEPQIHLPALETLFLWGVPNMISTGVKKYQQKCPSLQIVEAPKEIKKHMQHVTSERARANESELQEIVNIETPLIPSVGFQYFLNFHNLKQIKIRRNKKLKTLFNVSICRNLPQLSKLTIKECEELVNVVEDDSHDHHHMNYSSIFQKLEDLSVEDCNKLEFIFPLSLFGSLQKLKSLNIKKAAELKYIFWNENKQLQIHLPALQALSLLNVPKLINICAKKYHVSLPSLQSFALGDLQDFNGRSFLDLMAYLQEMQLNVKIPKIKDLMKIIKDVQKLTRLGIQDSKIEEVLNLEGVKIEGTILTLSLEEMWLKDLSELNHICKGPKYILSLPNLGRLYIIACKKLRVIFSVSIVKSLPQLSYLKIEDCNELVDIIEESVEGHLDQICFPKLKQISINHCNSLKCLLLISKHGMFPKLRLLKIEEASKLEQVFIHKQDDMQKMTMMDEVFPELSNVTLRKLPRLVTICEGIDFQSNICFNVNDCPKYQGINHIREGLENGDSENQATTNASPDFAKSKKEKVKEIEAKDPTPALLEKQALEGSTTKPRLRSASLHRIETWREFAGLASVSSITEETLVEIQTEDSNRASTKQASETSAAKSHLRGTSLPELEDEHKTSESIKQLQQEGLVETKTTKASHKTNIPFHDNSIDVILKERAEEGSTLEDVVAATMVVDLALRNSWDLMPSKSRSETSMAHSLELAADMSVKSLFVSQVEGPKFGPSTLASLSSEKTEKEAVRIQTSQLSINPTWTNSESIKDTKEYGHEENHADEYSYSRKQCTGPINKLPRKDSTPNAKKTTKGIDENATTTYKSPMAIPFMRALAIKEIGDHSSIQEEVESGKPIKATLPQVIPSLHYLVAVSQIVDAGTSFSRLEICEIFKLVELKHGETDLLSQALEQYPQLLLPHEHRTYRIIAWSYRVLVDILVILATKTPNSITPFEKSTLEANLNEAIVLGFDKNWVEFVRAKVFGVDMSNVSKAKEEIQVMEMKLREIDCKLLGLSEDRKKVIVNMNMFRDIVSAKDKPFGI